MKQLTPAPGATKGKDATRFREPTWDELRGLTADERRITDDVIMLPQLLKKAGYATGMFGKWHLGYRAEFSPAAHGFGYFFGLKSGYHDFYAHTAGNGKPRRSSAARGKRRVSSAPALHAAIPSM